ncbi:hypothetical protein DL93DRAFT_2084299 [Clavulina sp. PMI_390]|nr:hypothetical protein DL93DRAFT_2084299 [Clavulina sp. PMI_390]
MLSWSNLAVDSHTIALEHAIEAVQFAEDGARRFASSPTSTPQQNTKAVCGLSDDWDDFILPMALSAVMEASCALKQWGTACAYGKRAVEMSRGLFQTSPSDRTAEVFASALQLYELSSARVRKHADRTRMSSKEWSDLLAWLPDPSWEMHKFVEGKVRGLA